MYMLLYFSQVYQCYKSGVEALKEMRKLEGCNPDNAEAVMAELDEVWTIHNRTGRISQCYCRQG